MVNGCFTRELGGTEISGFCSFASASTVKLCFGGGWGDCSQWAAVSWLVIPPQTPPRSNVALQLVGCSFLTAVTNPPTQRESYSAVGVSYSILTSHSPHPGSKVALQLMSCSCCPHSLPSTLQTLQPSNFK